MSLHASVSTKTRVETAPETETEFDTTRECAECGSTRFWQRLYQSYTEEKFANTNQSLADYQNLEHTETYDADPWECSECGAEPTDPDLLQLLEEM